MGNNFEVSNIYDTTTKVMYDIIVTNNIFYLLGWLLRIIKGLFLPHQCNILSMCMDYSYLCKEYLAYMTRIFLKDFMMLTKVQFTIHIHIIVVLLTY